MESHTLRDQQRRTISVMGSRLNLTARTDLPSLIISVSVLVRSIEITRLL